ncbi:two-component system response regulator CreB [Pseudodesulfovibrio sp. JC047]|uniref:two-component system response regulator CreB n=1 Tax=Pseudodesulfovibrio sp. JC047 TaxID=2683199 RepID=UPI0013D7C67D|nr:two-component system response regulator CreB [Pseudodesulfovibrio sp. JC047]NDV18665.1 two-component system response regulator CreB [Pseudodesulfovibrio sp. JC047]
MSQQTIILIEDEVAIADAVSFSLQQEGFAVRHHVLGREGLEDYRAHGADLIILDVGLPDISGLAVCRELRVESLVPVVFLTAKSDEIDRVMGLEIGGDDYVTKPFSPRELVARVRAILRRTNGEPMGSGRASGAHSASLFEVHEASGVVVCAGRELSLTRQEFLVLSTLLSQPGRVFSRSQIMEQAWESPDTSLERAVDTHIKSLRSKLRAVLPNADPIVTKRGFGYSIEVD